MDRALELASEMTTGGKHLDIVPSIELTRTLAIASAPLALRAAKLAISRAPELSLESGVRNLLLIDTL